MNGKIAIAGNGWGFWATLNGLIKNFINVEVYNASEENIVNEFIKLNPSNTFKKSDDYYKFTSDIIICAGLRDVIPKSLIEKKTLINIHYSLLPQYRGLHSVVWAILNNEEFLGYTVHIMNEYIDDGPIIYQYKEKNDFVSTATEYIEKFNLHVQHNIGNIIEQYLRKEIIPSPQDKRYASWVGKRNYNDCRINFNSTIKELQAFFRALNSPYPLPYFIYNGETFTVNTPQFYHCEVKTHIGRILNIDMDGIWVKIKDGYIIFKEIIDNKGNLCQKENFRIGTYV